MMKRIVAVAFLLNISILSFAQDSQFKKELLVDKQYLLFPVKENAQKRNLDFKAKDFNTYFDIKISSHPDSIDYWVFMDVNRFKGQKVIVSGRDNDYLKEAFKLILLDDEIKTKTPIYFEQLRPQLHFSSRRGWNNDPNGLVYYNGEYHLYYQHNPYGWAWGNMHWGHAVSTDLVHWQELPDALYPDHLGTMFSGSAVVDYQNTSGFQEGDEKVIVAAYTANSPDGQSQCIAYSNDRGRTFSKYEKNPVLPAIQRFATRNERDPKVFWYEPNRNWVMVLFEGLGNSIYTSNNLKEWTYESHVEGFWECPELFELSIDGQEDNKKWVMYGASGTYMIGRFDGRQFIPETDKLRYLVAGMYAAQTYNNTPDGRRIQIGWGRITSKGMPFNQMMNFPLELNLKTTKQGPRLHASPIAEITSLYKKSHSYKNLTFGQEDVNDLISAIKHPLLHIRAVFKIVNAHDFSIEINGYKFTYNMNMNKLNDTFIPLIDLKLNLEFIVDVNSIEVFVNEGQYVMCIPHNFNNHKPGIAFYGRNKTVIESLDIHELNSIWHSMNGKSPQ